MQIEHHVTTGFIKMSARRYFLIRSKQLFEPLWVKLGDMESRLFRRSLRGKSVDRPVYVTGMARTGTTITLEMLSKHRDVATHLYRDMAQPYLPLVWHWLTSQLPLPKSTPSERVCKDRILVTRDSPEAVEETIWMWFFPHLHEEARSAVLDSTTSHRTFEAYYGSHIAKLLLARRRSRYLAKSDDNLTRLSYLVRLFPGARFIVMVRRPTAHFASWIKQHDLYVKMQERDPRWFEAIRSVGHHAFGLDQRFVNFGDGERVRQIRDAWDAGQRARAFGMYWASMYGHVLDLAARDPLVRNAILFVRYEDLCAAPGETIDRMLAHAELDASSFENVREQYVGKLAEPQYYTTAFDDGELHAIDEATREVATRLGYECCSAKSWCSA